MGPSTTIAVAMAVYDDAPYLRRALEALAAQTFRGFHVTVHDDGSRDGSAAVAESYAGRLPIRVVRGEHQGRHLAKQAAWAEAEPAPFLLVLDSDIVLPSDALARMLAAAETDPTLGAISARALAFAGRRYGPSQRFLERFFYDVNSGPGGEGRWIVGGCVLLRRAALDGIDVVAASGEDNQLSERLRARWRLLAPAALEADHLGVPTTLAGLLRRSEREGVRVAALVRELPGTRQLGNVARLVPLPLVLLAVAGAVGGVGWVAAVAGAALAGYVAAFLVASWRVLGGAGERVGGAALFTFGNLGFGWGYLREALRGRAATMREPARRF